MTDLSIAASDFFSNQYHARSDYDFNGHVSGADLSLLLRAVYAQASTSSGATCTP